ncbi:MAG TPA: gamma carbonic anhydrase family protein [Trebonia sp.]|nr:gamma carbonic anhydrase family protein [Trebonia sp.]
MYSWLIGNLLLGSARRAYPQHCAGRRSYVSSRAGASRLIVAGAAAADPPGRQDASQRSLVHHGLVPLFSFEGLEPVVSPTAWIAPTATLVGDVHVEDEASVWYGAVLRADFGPIFVRRGANIQDGSVLHGDRDPATEVGAGATVGHLCVVHGARIGAEALIGNGATVLDGAVIGGRALVAAGATVPPGMNVPDGMLAAGVPARIVGELTSGARTWVETNPAAYRALAGRYAAGVRPVP